MSSAEQDERAIMPTISGTPGRSLLRLHRPRILIVEDDVDMWKLIERAVHAANPDVEIHWAADAESARHALRRYAFDVVLADFMLEDSRNGWSVLSESRRLQPGARVAMASSLPLRPPEAEGCPFLQKPFDIASCADFVNRLLV
jgi:DNA-binding response OmpR family regulator